MTRQLTQPPAYIWTRIEKILDEQENEKKLAEEFGFNDFNETKKIRFLPFFLASFTGTGLLALIVLKFLSDIKSN